MTSPQITETVDGIPVVYNVVWVQNSGSPLPESTIGIFTRLSDAKTHAEGYVAWCINQTRHPELFHHKNPWGWVDLSIDPNPELVPGHRILWSYSQDFGIAVFVSSEPINVVRNPNGTETYVG